MLFLRSLIFNILLIGGSLFWSCALLWSLLLPWRMSVRIVANVYVRYVTIIEKYIMGITLKIDGLENIPSDGKFIIAAKHQSAFETLKIPYMKEFHFPAIVLKKELTYLPIWGLYPTRLGMIAIDRGSVTVALRSIIRGSKRAIESNRPIIIFPQGTRTRIGEKIPYRAGIAQMYKELNVPVIPLALNSGKVWPKNSFMKRPGVVTFKLLPAIQPGLSNAELMQRLENTIESESDKLL